MPEKGEDSLDYTDRLQRLAIHDERLDVADFGDVVGDPTTLDPKTMALARVAALVSVGGAAPSFGAHVDAAVSAGSTAAEIVDMLVGVIPIVGLPRAVAAAPKIALALGHDLEVDVVGDPAVARRVGRRAGDGGDLTAAT
ncbi:carboxymuconolactone decarboxylase family protein [Agromyces badenianii]|uniref:carboxymuconolactone decarboxylase family protein n=1 Tax=Agromyces badenianii TaxID=2080742 RepID=UPI001F43ABB5|nr:carboxymuconolactone decarboxylase family protein [Agromyces badenianii]